VPYTDVRSPAKLPHRPLIAIIYTFVSHCAFAGTIDVFMGLFYRNHEISPPDISPPDVSPPADSPHGAFTSRVFHL